MEKNNDMDVFKIQFPIIRQPAKTIANDIKGMTAEETQEAMKKMFDKLEEMTGLKPIIVGNSLPTNVLFPKENTQPENI